MALTNNHLWLLMKPQMPRDFHLVRSGVANIHGDSSDHHNCSMFLQLLMMLRVGLVAHITYNVFYGIVMIS